VRVLCWAGLNKWPSPNPLPKRERAFAFFTLAPACITITIGPAFIHTAIEVLIRAFDLRRTGIAFCLLVIATTCAAQEWTRFRGPNGTGASEAEGIPAKWTLDDYNWRVELPGIGHSSPVIWEDKIFVLSADPTTAKRYCLCLNTTDGGTEWVREFPSSAHTLHTRSSYASATPAVDAEQVYFAWSTPAKTTLICFDHAGQTRWELDLGRWVSQHGFGTSPILYKDLVILFNSQDNAEKLPPGEMGGESFMMAFDKKTGRERWRTPLESTVVS
jgi:outer membrane protein assembly factor BamB